MRPIQVAAVSMNGFLGEPARVLRAMDRWCAQAGAAGADLVLFPELVIHGHCTPNTAELAEPVPEGPSVGALCEMARRHGLVISAGLSERDGASVFNTQVLAGPEGYIGKQRKLHLSRDEANHYSGGTELPVFDLGFCKVGTVICYDNQFPEVGRILALRGADLLLMPHAARFLPWADTPESEAAARRHSHDFVAPYALRARENACFAVLTDQAGRAGTLDTLPPDHENQPHHAGVAIIWGPDGAVLARAQMERVRDEMIVALLDPALLARERGLVNYTLRTRRPELFGELTRTPAADRPPNRD